MSIVSIAPFPSSRPADPDRPDAALDRMLRRAVLTGLALVLLVPLARASTDALGWLPLWLVGMLGWIALARRDRNLVITFVVCLGFALYINGASSDWSGGGAMGGRRYDGFLLPIGLGIAVLVEWLLLYSERHPRRVAEPHRFQADGEQLVEQVIHRRVAGGAGQHLLATGDRLPNEFDHGGRLAGPRRAVNDGDIISGERERDGGELGLIQSRVFCFAPLPETGRGRARHPSPQPPPRFGEGEEARLPLPQQHGP